jgi:regulation of enolase protein 1 (concanavalin A-like superfamily)
MFNSCNWHNEPLQWSVIDGLLKVRSDEKTDFWRDTYYGFTRDSGHFFW